MVRWLVLVLAIVALTPNVRAQTVGDQVSTGAALTGVGGGLIVTGSLAAIASALSFVVAAGAAGSGVGDETRATLFLPAIGGAVVSALSIAGGTAFLLAGQSQISEAIAEHERQVNEALSALQARAGRRRERTNPTSAPEPYQPDTPSETTCQNGGDCPADGDDDGVLDERDRCPDDGGPADNGGCPSRVISPAQ